MKPLIDSYLTIFLHPFRVHDYLWDGIPLPGRELNPVNPLSLTEVLSLSWVIVILRSFVDLMLLNLMFSAVSSYFTTNDDFFTLLGLNTSFGGYYLFLIKLIIDTLLFPLMTYAGALVTEFFLKHLGNYLEVPDCEQKAHTIVSNSLTSNFIRIVPIFGDIAQSILATVHIFAGLKKSYGLTSRAALLALSLPLLLVCFFGTFVFVCLVLIAL